MRHIGVDVGGAARREVPVAERAAAAADLAGDAKAIGVKPQAIDRVTYRRARGDGPPHTHAVSQQHKVLGQHVVRQRRVAWDPEPTRTEILPSDGNVAPLPRGECRHHVIGGAAVGIHPYTLTADPIQPGHEDVSAAGRVLRQAVGKRERTGERSCHEHIEPVRRDMQHLGISAGGCGGIAFPIRQAASRIGRHITRAICSGEAVTVAEHDRSGVDATSDENGPGASHCHVLDVVKARPVHTDGGVVASGAAQRRDVHRKSHASFGAPVVDGQRHFVLSDRIGAERRRSAARRQRDHSRSSRRPGIAGRRDRVAVGIARARRDRRLLIDEDELAWVDIDGIDGRRIAEGGDRVDDAVRVAVAGRDEDDLAGDAGGDGGDLCGHVAEQRWRVVGLQRPGADAVVPRWQHEQLVGETVSGRVDDPRRRDLGFEGYDARGDGGGAAAGRRVGQHLEGDLVDVVAAAGCRSQAHKAGIVAVWTGRAVAAGGDDDDGECGAKCTYAHGAILPMNTSRSATPVVVNPAKLNVAAPPPGMPNAPAA